MAKKVIKHDAKYSNPETMAKNMIQLMLVVQRQNELLKKTMDAIKDDSTRENFYPELLVLQNDMEKLIKRLS